MDPLALTAEETRLLRMIAASRLSALAVEIAHTHTREFRELLQHQRAVLETAVVKLAPPSTRAEPTGYRRS
jgi:hypothetical protein